MQKSKLCKYSLAKVASWSSFLEHIKQIIVMEIPVTIWLVKSAGVVWVLVCFINMASSVNAECSNQLVKFKCLERPSFGSEGQPSSLSENIFQLYFSKQYIHHYDVTITPGNCPIGINRYLFITTIIISSICWETHSHMLDSSVCFYLLRRLLYYIIWWTAIL